MDTWTKFDFPPNFPRLSGGMERNAGECCGMLEECWESPGNGGIANQEILKEKEKSYLSRKKINFKQ